jgi:hypothetical protein
VSDVLRRSRRARAPGSGHDVSSQDVNLDLPDAHFCCTTGFEGCNVAMDRRPTEKQALAGDFAGFTALGAHEARQESLGVLAPARPRNTGSTCHDRHGREQEREEGPRHCIACQHLEYTCLHALSLHVYWFVHVHHAPSRASPWMHEKAIKLL